MTLNVNELLFEGCNNGDIGQVAKSISQGANVDWFGGRPLERAAKRGYLNIVCLLIKSNANVTPEAAHPLHYACKQGRTRIVNALLKSGANPNIYDDTGYTPLHYSCKQGRIAITLLLLRFGANFNAVTHDETATPVLHLASSMEIIKLLLQSNVDIDCTNTDLETALHDVSRKGRHVLMRYLIERGANVRVLNRHDATPLHVACTGVIVNTLVLAGSNVNAVDKSGSTPLHSAVCRGIGPQDSTNNLNSELGRKNALMVARALIRAGANLMAQDNKGHTPLSSAAFFQRWLIVRTLLEQLGPNLSVVLTAFGKAGSAKSFAPRVDITKRIHSLLFWKNLTNDERHLCPFTFRRVVSTVAMLSVMRSKTCLHPLQSSYLKRCNREIEPIFDESCMEPNSSPPSPQSTSITRARKKFAVSSERMLCSKYRAPIPFRSEGLENDTLCLTHQISPCRTIFVSSACVVNQFTRLPISVVELICHHVAQLWRTEDEEWIMNYICGIKCSSSINNIVNVNNPNTSSADTNIVNNIYIVGSQNSDQSEIGASQSRYDEASYWDDSSYTIMQEIIESEDSEVDEVIESDKAITNNPDNGDVCGIDNSVYDGRDYNDDHENNENKSMMRGEDDSETVENIRKENERVKALPPCNYR